MLYMKIFYLLLILLFISCQSPKEKIIISENTVYSYKTDLSKCIPADTLLKNKSSVRYVKSDSSFDVEVQINGKRNLLGFGFDCTAPNGLVPKIYLSNESILCLKRGYGQHYREFIICHLNKDSIEIKEYETALDFNYLTNEVAFQKYDSAEMIYVENVASAKKKAFVLPHNLKYKKILLANLKKQKLFLQFENHQKVEFVLNTN